MPIPDLYYTQMFAPDPAGWGKPDTGAEILTAEGREGIVAGVIFVRRRMDLERREIVGCRLDIIPIEGTNGKERGDLYRNFKTGRMRSDAPVIDVEPVVRPQDYVIAQEVVEAQSDGQLYPLRRQLLHYGRGAVGKIDAVERQPQVSGLVGKVDQDRALHPLVDDLCKGKGRGVGVPAARRDMDFTTL